MPRSACPTGPRSLALLLVVSFGPACGPRILKPLPAPARVAPSIAEPRYPPPAKHGRVFIDVDGESASVSHVLRLRQRTLSTPFAITTPSGGRITAEAVTNYTGRDVKPLCRTPCVIDLPYGPQAIELGSAERDYSELFTIRIEPGTAAYRHTMGRKRGPGGALGATAVFAPGVALLLTSPLLFAAEEPDVGVAFLGIGAAMTAVGSYLLYLFWPERQAGSGTYWSLDAPPPDAR